VGCGKRVGIAVGFFGATRRPFTLGTCNLVDPESMVVGRVLKVHLMTITPAEALRNGPVVTSHHLWRDVSRVLR